MSLLSLFLLPMALACASEFRINDYVMNIENNTLMSVQATGRSSDELNLSDLALQSIDRSAFNNVSNVKFLNLANNSLAGLPESVFSNLKNLDHLSLTDNNIKHFTRAFVGLGNLKSLNISNNPVQSFGPGELYGLSNSVDVFTQGISFKRISTTVFDNVALSDLDDEAADREYAFDDEDDDYSYDGDEVSSWVTDEDDEERKFRAKVCIDQGKVKLLNAIKRYEVLPDGCHEVKTNHCCTLYLDDLGITEFDQGWYQFKNSRYASIDTIAIRGNNISRVTRELLNDLPESITTVDLSRNQIDRLESGVITNFGIHFLYLSNNLIEEVENGALKNTNLWQLHLNGNRLKSTKFIATLPPSMVKLFLKRNQITELSNLPVLNFPQLSDVFISENNITVVRKNSLRGLPFLLNLDLSKNRIRTLERGCFRGAQSLHYIHLRDNDLADLDGGVFDGLPRLIDLDLGRNKLTEITEGFRDSLPHNLDTLKLDYNAIESLESGSFVNVPKRGLNLEGNKISKIAKGSFNVPGLYGVDLEHQPMDLSALLGPLFAGNKLAMALSGGLAVPTKQKGIGRVNLAKNSIRKLENGDLFGLEKGRYNYVYVSQTPIEVIQGGLFNDV